MRLTAVLAAVVMAMFGEWSHAQPRSDEDVLRDLWSDSGASEGLFAASTLQQLPFAQIAEFVTDLVARCGDLETVHASDGPGHYVLQTARCELPTKLARAQSGEIVSLWFGAPARNDASLDEVLDALKRFDGMASYAVLENGNMIASHAPDEPLAVGSAFKLVVLAALQQRIEAREARWADVLTLSARHISLPTGRLRDMPPGSPLTLHTLAALMISESDNTATDVLIDFVGRERLEALSGLSPFLTTREFFQLKSDPELYARYAEADPAARRELLGGLSDRPLPRVEQVLRPLQPHAEWRISTAALCAWMEKVAEIELAQINSGPLDKSRWQRVSFNAGSELGVLNLTTSARDGDGREFCVSATWNAAQTLDPEPLVERYATLFLRLSDRPRQAPRPIARRDRPRRGCRRPNRRRCGPATRAHARPGQSTSRTAADAVSKVALDRCGGGRHRPLIR